MKKILCMILLFLGICFLFMPHSVAAGVSQGLQVCAAAILPSLFPFFILTDLWIHLGYTATLARYAAPVTERIFHLPGSATSAILLGCIGGYPMGARTVAQLYQEGQLPKDAAEQALYFCNNAGPAFVFGVMGTGIFSSTLAGAALYLIHIFSAFVVGTVLRPGPIFHDGQHMRSPEMPLSKAVVNSISQSGMTTVQICVFVVFFSILTRLLSDLAPHSSLTTLLGGILELAGGATLLSASSFPPAFKFAAAAFLLGTGGLCVMMQTQSILQTAGLSCKTVYIGKLMQACISGVLALLVFPFLPISSPCMAAIPSFSLPFWQQTAVILLITIFLTVFLKKSSGKVRGHRI